MPPLFRFVAVVLERSFVVLLIACICWLLSVVLVCSVIVCVAAAALLPACLIRISLLVANAGILLTSAVPLVFESSRLCLLVAFLLAVGDTLGLNVVWAAGYGIGTYGFCQVVAPASLLFVLCSVATSSGYCELGLWLCLLL